MSQAITRTNGLRKMILVRLLAMPKAGVKLGDFSKDLKPYFEHKYSDAQWKQVLGEELAETEKSGLIQAKPYALTERGRAEALKYLGVNNLSAKITWPILKDKYLVAKALGLSADSDTVRQRIGKADGLRAAVLSKRLGLAVGPTPTLNQAMDALAWRQLGVETNRKISRGPVVAQILSTLLGNDKAVDVKVLESQIPAQQVGARNSDAKELKFSLLRQLLDETAAEATETNGNQGVFDLGDFADVVLTMARQCETGRYGDDRVFVSHVWRQFNSQSMKPEMPLQEFKKHLLAAQRQDLLRLRGADLMNDKDPEDVRQSEIETETSPLHFVSTVKPTREEEG